MQHNIDNQNNSRILTKDQRYNILTTEFNNVAYLASVDQRSFTIVKDKLEEIYKLLKPIQEIKFENRTLNSNTKTVLNPKRVRSHRINGSEVSRI